MNRREFSKLFGLGAAGLCLPARGYAQGQPVRPLPGRVLTTDLGGSAWTFHQDGTTESLPAQIPGDHYTDLLRAGKIPDPYYRDNNKLVQWAAQKSWIYERPFQASPEQIVPENVELVCHGLDTFATVTLNGVRLGATNNMFRTWVFDVRHQIKAGPNVLQIRFDPLPDDKEVAAMTAAYIEAHPEVDPAPTPTPATAGGSPAASAAVPTNPGPAPTPRPHVPFHPRSWIRKAPYQWGWDWCKPILTMGVWKAIELRSYDSMFADLAVVQHHHPDGSVELDLKADVHGAMPAGCQVRAHLLEDGAAGEASAAVKEGAASLSLTVAKPKLWWPNGMGDPTLYTVEVQLLDPTGQLLDTMRKRIGLRRFEAVTSDHLFTLKVNGEPFFGKGANWLPPDNLVGRITPAILRRSMEDAAACNFNLIRLWGGGFYEDDSLYDRCDELGIALIFEFKFTTTAYPVFDKDFVANVNAELDDQIHRVRHHPSIAIWSGNNEIRKFVGYTELFDKVIGDQVRKLAPGQVYVVSSGGFGAQDAHDWGLGHGRRPFSHYAGTHGFVAEFGLQSYLEPASTRSFATEADLAAGIDSPILQYHECSAQKEIVNPMVYYFGKIPANIDDVFWLSQILQAFGIRFGVEHWRRDRPKSTAALVWQYNDSWPGQTWSMMDYYGRWKALQYHSRHMFAPLLVSGEVDAERGTVDIYVVNDRLTGGKASLSWNLVTTEGKSLRRKDAMIDLPINGSALVETASLTDAEKQGGLANLLLWMTITPQNGPAESNVAFFVLPGQLTLPVPAIKTVVAGAGRQFTVVLSSPQPALWTWLNLESDPDARCSDNFVHLQPGTPVTITVDCEKDHSTEDFRARLKVRSVREFITPGIALPVLPPGWLEPAANPPNVHPPGATSPR